MLKEAIIIFITLVVILFIFISKSEFMFSVIKTSALITCLYYIYTKSNILDQIIGSEDILEKKGGALSIESDNPLSVQSYKIKSYDSSFTMDY